MKESKRNFKAFLWHAFWFSLTFAFTDYNTVLPAMIVKAGGGSWHIGLLTFISVGIPLLAQLIFTPFISSRPAKKPFLLLGINMRILALAGIGWTIYYFGTHTLAPVVIFLIYLWMLLFTFSGAFAGLSYTHLIGISFYQLERKKFLVFKQALTAIGLALSAFVVRNLLKGLSFPQNYMYLFSLASGMLLIASLGFWVLKEPKLEKVGSEYSVWQLLKDIPEILKKNPNLFYLIIIANFLSASLIAIPFLTGSLKERFAFSGKLVGNLLLFQYIGMVLSNFVWKRIVRLKGFKGLLYNTAFIVGSAPIAGVFLRDLNAPVALYFLFFYIGSGISANRIAMDGGLLEISTNENRVLFSGVFGAMNLLSSLLPLATGLLFDLISQKAIFFFFGLLSLSSIYFIKRMVCPVDKS